MRKLQLLQIGVTVFLLSGCATMTPEQAAALQAVANRPVTCKGSEDCQVKWGRALTWVRGSSKYKLDQVTDMVISTKGPWPDDPSPAFIITKTAIGGGKYSISFDGGCGNLFGCVPDMLSEKVSFVRDVMQDYK